MNHLRDHEEGFSLLELVVSIGIFAVTVVAAVAIMIDVFSAQSKGVAIKDVLDNERFTLELITRELRTGSNVVYTSTRPPGCPSNGLQFTSYNQGSAQERFYYLADTDGDTSADTIMRVAMPAGGSIDCTAVNPQRLTSREIIVDAWSLILSGTEMGPNDGQPLITLGFTMHSRDARWGAETSISAQTTVAQRGRDL